jgi:hypothetical protein
MNNIFKILIILALLYSCDKKQYTPIMCNQLSFRSFKGVPKATNELRKSCSNIKYKYTSQVCQKILTKFILTGSQSIIIKEFGKLAPNCLSESDLNRFLKK